MKLLVTLCLLSPLAFASAPPQKPVTLKSILLEELRTTHDEKDWFVPLKGALAGLTPEQASWKPERADHSIGQLANHLLFWNSHQLAKLKNPATPPYDGKNDETFNAFDAARWAETVQKLDRVLAELEALVAQADEKQLQAWASSVSHVATHNAYHAGQILTLRKMQGAWDAANGVR